MSTADRSYKEKENGINIYVSALHGDERLNLYYHYHCYHHNYQQCNSSSSISSSSRRSGRSETDTGNIRGD
jgi:hypothetical protein